MLSTAKKTHFHTFLHACVHIQIYLSALPGNIYCFIASSHGNLVLIQLSSLNCGHFTQDFDSDISGANCNFWLKFYYTNTEIEEANWLTLDKDITKPGDGFDAIICIGNSFPHLPNSEDFSNRTHKQALKNFCEMLKPGGVMIIDHRNFDAILDTGKAPERNIYYKVSDDTRNQIKHFTVHLHLLWLVPLGMLGTGLWNLQECRSPPPPPKKKKILKKKKKGHLKNVKFGPYIWLNPRNFQGLSPLFPITGAWPLDPTCSGLGASHQNIKSCRKCCILVYAPRQQHFSMPWLGGYVQRCSSSLHCVCGVGNR